MQNSGRNFIVWMLYFAPTHCQESSLVAFLMLTWTSIEVIRLPYYLSVLLKYKIYILTWLRYTIWIPLYPVGILLEMSLVWLCLWDKSKEDGMAFLFIFVRILMVGQLLAVAFNFKYLWNQRKKQFRKKKSA